MDLIKAWEALELLEYEEYNDGICQHVKVSVHIPGVLRISLTDEDGTEVVYRWSVMPMDD